MPAENLSNQFDTVLAGNGGSITAGAVTFIVASSTNAPAVPFRAGIGPPLQKPTEIVLVTGVAGTTWTVTRGVEKAIGVGAGTGVTHTDGEQVTAVVTTAALGPALLTAEAGASMLTNVTSAGDAGNRATHFQGTGLPAGWTQTVVNGTYVVAKSVLSWTPPAAPAEARFMQTCTPSGDFQILGRFRMSADSAITNYVAPGLMVQNAGGTEGMLLQAVPVANGALSVMLYSLDANAWSVRGASTLWASGGGWIYLMLERFAVFPGFAGLFSVDGVSFIGVGSYNKTPMVITLGGVRFAGASGGFGFHAACDQWDVNT